MHQISTELELWLAGERPEHRAPDALLTAEPPPRRSPTDAVRRRTGEALIEVGRRLLPAAEPRRSRAY